MLFHMYTILLFLHTLLAILFQDFCQSVNISLPSTHKNFMTLPGGQQGPHPKIFHFLWHPVRILHNFGSNPVIHKEILVYLEFHNILGNFGRPCYIKNLFGSDTSIYMYIQGAQNSSPTPQPGQKKQLLANFFETLLQFIS